MGSDPTSVNNVGEADAISLDYFPSVTDNADPWIPWLRKVLLADKTDFPTFTASSVLTGNELYGAGYAVAFAEVLKAEGKNVTRAGFLKEMTSMTLSDPAIMPLKYSKTNHQGLQGGIIAVDPAQRDERTGRGHRAQPDGLHHRLVEGFAHLDLDQAGHHTDPRLAEVAPLVLDETPSAPADGVSSTVAPARTR